jgi:hypothetical protein
MHRDIRYPDTRQVGVRITVNISQYILIIIIRSVTVAERTKACTALARSEAGIAGSNPTQGMDV